VQQTQIHVTVLGAALVLSAVILLARTSSTSSSEGGATPSGAPVEAKTTQASRPAGDDSSELQKKLAEIDSLISQAEENIRLANRKDGNEAQMNEVKHQLDEAQQAIEGLPETDPDVKRLRIKLGELRQLASRLSGL